MKRILGISDEIGTCDCCGRTDLKRTIAIESDGSISHLGTECASRAMGRRTSKGLMAEAIDAQILADREIAIQKRAADQAATRCVSSRIAGNEPR